MKPPPKSNSSAAGAKVGSCRQDHENNFKRAKYRQQEDKDEENKRETKRKGYNSEETVYRSQHRKGLNTHHSPVDHKREVKGQSQYHGGFHGTDSDRNDNLDECSVTDKNMKGGNKKRSQLAKHRTYHRPTLRNAKSYKFQLPERANMSKSPNADSCPQATDEQDWNDDNAWNYTSEEVEQSEDWEENNVIDVERDSVDSKTDEKKDNYSADSNRRMSITKRKQSSKHRKYHITLDNKYRERTTAKANVVKSRAFDSCQHDIDECSMDNDGEWEDNGEETEQNEDDYESSVTDIGKESVESKIDQKRHKYMNSTKRNDNRNRSAKPRKYDISPNATYHKKQQARGTSENKVKSSQWNTDNCNWDNDEELDYDGEQSGDWDERSMSDIEKESVESKSAQRRYIDASGKNRNMDYKTQNLSAKRMKHHIPLNTRYHKKQQTKMVNVDKLNKVDSCQWNNDKHKWDNCDEWDDNGEHTEQSEDWDEYSVIDTAESKPNERRHKNTPGRSTKVDSKNSKPLATRGKHHIALNAKNHRTKLTERANMSKSTKVNFHQMRTENMLGDGDEWDDNGEQTEQVEDWETCSVIDTVKSKLEERRHKHGPGGNRKLDNKNPNRSANLRKYHVPLNTKYHKRKLTERADMGKSTKVSSYQMRIEEHILDNGDEWDDNGEQTEQGEGWDECSMIDTVESKPEGRRHKHVPGRTRKLDDKNPIRSAKRRKYLIPLNTKYRKGKLTERANMGKSTKVSSHQMRIEKHTLDNGDEWDANGEQTEQGEDWDECSVINTAESKRDETRNKHATGRKRKVDSKNSNLSATQRKYHTPLNTKYNRRQSTERTNMGKSIKFSSHQMRIEERTLDNGDEWDDNGEQTEQRTERIVVVDSTTANSDWQSTDNHYHHNFDKIQGSCDEVEESEDWDESSLTEAEVKIAKKKPNARKHKEYCGRRHKGKSVTKTIKYQTCCVGQRTREEKRKAKINHALKNNYSCSTHSNLVLKQARDTSSSVVSAGRRRAYEGKIRECNDTKTSGNDGTHKSGKCDSYPLQNVIKTAGKDQTNHMKHERRDVMEALEEQRMRNRDRDKQLQGVGYLWGLNESNERTQASLETTSCSSPAAKSMVFTGRVITIIKEEFGFIRPDKPLPAQYNQKKHVFFRLKAVRPEQLNPKTGDKVRFTLGTRNPMKPMAVKPVLVSCQRKLAELGRHISEVSERLDMLHKSMSLGGEDVSAEKSHEYLLSLLSSLTFWECLSNYPRMTDEYVLQFLDILCKIEEHSHYFNENIKNIFSMLSRSPFLNPFHGSLKCFISSCTKLNDIEKVLQIRKFLLILLKYVPEKIGTVLILIKPMIPKDRSGIALFLYTLLQKSVKDVSGDIEDIPWNNLPLVPSADELLVFPLNEEVNLQPVKLKEPYASPEEYLDIYFRLLRADCFHSIRKGIRDLLNGKLDPRDMHVYHELSLVGIHVSSGENDITLALHVESTKEVKDWDHCSNLRFGNLLCISISGTFKDVIWASVTNRQLLKHHSIVLITLSTECNNFSDSDAILRLQQATSASLMVESPTYYMAYRPILNAFQNIDPERVSFKEELVYLKAPTQPVFGDNELLAMLDDEQTDFFTFDTSQANAMTKAVRHRIAIIQGPPGTGKTFIGLKLVQLLLSASKGIKLPILVLTYKNHVLDEFLKALYLIYPSQGDIIRIGGRSAEPELEACNLNSLKKSHERSRSLRSEMNDTYRQIESLQQRIEIAFMSLNKARMFNIECFLRVVTGKQILRLLLGCDWTKTNVSPPISTEEGKENVQRHHKGRNKRVITKDEVKGLVNSIQDSSNHLYLDEQAETLVKGNTILIPLIEAAIFQWLPAKQIFDQVEDQARFIFGHADTKRLTRDLVEDLRDYDDDEEYEDEVETERLAGSKGKCGHLSEKELLDQIKFFPKSKNKGGTFTPTLSDLATCLTSNGNFGLLLNIRNLWSLTSHERVKIVQFMIMKQFEEETKQFQDLVNEYRSACAAKKELDDMNKSHILLHSKVVGMTVTGAGIHHQLLKNIRPAIIIIEEAAEILEAQLLAAIGDWAKYLILIGDHKQLRPQVESYDLVRNFDMDKSMMERLILGGLPYSTLQFQSRMRPEFAELLLDIYPDLRNNIERVARNAVANCIKHSMFFWDHEDEETKERSYKNEEEATKTLQLALFLIQQGYKPEQITILAAYRGQVSLIKKKCSEAQRKFPCLFKEEEIKPATEKSNSDQTSSTSTNKPKTKCRLAIHTIDIYQGDENDFVIVSLVRSNLERQIGFLKLLNRRCVAQSRSRCGLYFVGSKSTLRSNSDWNALIKKMDNQGTVGKEIPLNCPNHPNETVIYARHAKDIPLQPFCKKSCPLKMECNKHQCPKICQPPHRHNKCTAIVDFTFAPCGHAGKKKCYQDEKDFSCGIVCSKMMSCGKHSCPNICQPEHKHNTCRAPVKFVFPTCKHTGTRECSQDESEIKCNQAVSVTLQTCLHPAQKICHIPDEDIVCREQCPRPLEGCGHPCEDICGNPCSPEHCKKACKVKQSCGHPCKKQCRPLHGHDRCDVKVSFTFSSCGHLGDKECWEKESQLMCEKQVNFKFSSCGHQGKKKCFQQEKDIICKDFCNRKLSGCGHPCGQKCGEVCRPSDCQLCAELKKAEQKKLQEELMNAYRDQIKAQIEKMTKEPPKKTFFTEELHPKGETASEYYEVEDKVKKYIQPGHKWFPVIIKIEKVTNFELEKRWLKAKMKLVDPKRNELKFHGTNLKGVEGITKDGFKLPQAKNQMYGPGIYFATDSSKSAQDMYTQGSRMLLLCDVLLGRSHTVESAMRDMSAEKLKTMGYDSVYAKRKTRSTGGVRYDEFVIYNPDQAFPKYIIHYQTPKYDSVIHRVSTSTDTFEKYSILPKREIDRGDSLDIHYRFAESQFLRLMSKTGKHFKITSVDYYVNPGLIKKFKAKEEELIAKYGKKKVSQRVPAFHGTMPDNVEAIMKENFCMDKIKRCLYGDGIYFSEFPEISIGYGAGLLLCEVLPGKSLVCNKPFSGPLKEGYDSHTVRPTDAQGRGEMIVINNPDQILPCYVINFTSCM